MKTLIQTNHEYSCADLLIVKRISLALLAMVFAVGGCQRSPDYLAIFDDTVELEWRPATEDVDPFAFIEQGGHYQYDPEFTAENHDQAFLIPLMKKLRDEHKLELIGLVYDETAGELYAVIAELPESEAEREAIRKTLKEADAPFEGLIFDQWGHRWFGLDYFNPEEVNEEDEEFMKKYFSD